MKFKIGETKVVKNWELKRLTVRQIQVLQLKGTYSDCGFFHYPELITWDNPYAIPKYVKEAVRKLFIADMEEN